MGALEAWKEAEREWLMTKLGRSIANLGYLVGCGVPPTDAHLLRAADMLVDRYFEFIREAVERARNGRAMPFENSPPSSSEPEEGLSK
jgi:hypothetical protein